jgi:hypothetical protein
VARYWLSMDFGVDCDATGLFAALDRQGAAECGEGVATFESDQSREAIEQTLLSAAAPGGTGPMSRAGRLYLIGPGADGKTTGRFILGGRKRPPWDGCAEDFSDTTDE